MLQREMREYIKTVDCNETITINKKGLLTLFYGMMDNHMECDKMFGTISSAFHKVRHNDDLKKETYYGI